MELSLQILLNKQTLSCVKSKKTCQGYKKNINQPVSIKLLSHKYLKIFLVSK